MLGLGFTTTWLMFWKVICWAEGEVHGSLDSFSVQAKLVLRCQYPKSLQLHE